MDLGEIRHQVGSSVFTYEEPAQLNITGFLVIVRK